MSISKLRSKSALGRHENGKATKKPTLGVAVITATTTNNATQYVGANKANSNSGNVTPTSATKPTTAITTTTTAKISASSVALTVANTTQQPQQQPQSQLQPQQQQQQQNLPQNSLLKIEPFVPTFNTRLRRPIGRSYSTLSSTYIKAATNLSGLHIVKKNEVRNAGLVVGAAIEVALPKTTRNPVGHLRSRYHNIKTITRQRSKSTSSSSASASNRLAAAKGNSNNISHNNTNGNNVSYSNNVNIVTAINTNGAIVTPQPNGICRIARLLKEQEKLPDRINYDRRGLSAIPIFENEPNLRLLSLQHNLINVFHIPKESPAFYIPETVTQPTKLDDVAYNCNFGQRLNRQINANHQLRTQHGSVSRFTLALTSPKSSKSSNSLANKQSPTQIRAFPIPPPPPPSTPPPLTTYTIQIGNSNNASSIHTNQLLKRNGMLQQLKNNGTQLTPSTYYHQQQQQQQQQQQLQYRFAALKKSKSFVTNYSRHLQSIKRNLQKSGLAKVDGNVFATNGGTQLKSFDSNASGLTSDSASASASASTLIISESGDEEQQRQQLEIKNKQLTASYGAIFHNLVFLDLYNNQIERIGNLDGLPTLSVLLLGKNRITDISGLHSLRQTLRVLDLHGNKIISISNKINCLLELKSLNLAGNQIRQINHNDFNGLLNLKELNLKRNKIRRINGLQDLTALERLWLCHNELQRVEDMTSIAKAANLLEVTIENNPVSLAGDCVSFLVSYLPHLQSLSQMPITEQVRQAAMTWRKNKEISDANNASHSADGFTNIRREEVISNARTNWELLRSQQTVHNVLRNQRCMKPNELEKINESNEINTGSVEMQEVIKLPPIQQNISQPQPQEQQTIQTNSTIEQKENNGRLSRSSGSSLGPNVDSSSSCYSTENEAEQSNNSTEKSGSKNKGKKQNNTESLTDQKQQIYKLKQKNLVLKTDSDILTKSVELKQHPITPTTPTKSNKYTSANTSENSTITATTTNEKSKAPPQLTTLNSNQTTSNLSARSNSNINLTVLPQTDMAVAAVTASNVPRTKTNTQSNSQPYPSVPTPPITVNSNILNLGLPATTTATTNVVTTPVATTGTCKRYMPGSLMRSQTIASSSSNSNSNSSANNALQAASNGYGKHSNIAKLNAGLQIPTKQNTANNSHTTNATTASNVTATPTYTTTTVTNNKITPATNSTTTATTLATATATGPAVVTTSTKHADRERDREQGGDYLIEICGRYLNIYGQGALRFIDKQWNSTKASDVHTLNFSYINFDSVTTVLPRIKFRFPNAENFVFRETNISCLGQLNALGELQGITSLCIDPEGNPVTTKYLWRQYAVYRLSHWGLKQLNGVEVTEADIEKANIIYAGLSDLVLWSMPEVMLQPLLARLRLDETCTASKMSPKEWLAKEENKSLRLVVGKEALQWKKSNNTNNISNNANNSSNNHSNANIIFGPQLNTCDIVYPMLCSAGNGVAVGALVTQNTSALSTRERGKIHFALLLENTCNAIEKLHKLETLWPSLLLDIVRNTLLDYSQMDVYVCNLMDEIMK
ncbi:uncharacterized protein LOC119680166 [Teleopsis dalmanni]|uniref:uncharacterized protein LOC119680166 n=1 Tax=Teleopsis dalmanni TaxID=139649 RepID=UPI0018CF7331|nr:uncharacterized protein LOC119680166 [Teleopsis dalmanni]